MCRAEQEGGRRCPDHRRNRSTAIENLRPDPCADRPDVDWSTDEASTPEKLFEGYPNYVAQLVVDTMTAAKRQEAQMTTDILEALPDGARMHGLAFRMKSPDSFARKLNDRCDASPMRAPEAIADEITDVIRYTAIAEPDQLVPTARTMAGQLAGRGWSVIEVEQSYLDGNPYKGLHMLARNPDGRVAEFQFHTEASQKVKDDTHLDYEAVRNRDLPAEQRTALVEKMTAIWAQIPPPAGIDGLTEIGGCTVTPKRYTRSKTN